MDFDTQKWLDIAKGNPVLVILVAGLIAGSGVAQMIKLMYIAICDTQRISEARYRAGMNALSILSTYLLTYMLWHAMIPEDSHGLGKVASLLSAFSAPFAYKTAKALIAWKFPDLAAKMGDPTGKTEDKQ